MGGTMACFELFPHAAASAWIGSALLASGAALFAYSRPFTVEKIGALGLEFKFQEPIAHQGDPRTKKLSFVVLIIGGLFAGAGVFKTNFPVEWPKKLTDVCTAELQISAIDDYMKVRVNDHLVATGRYGETPDWVDVKALLHKGPNKIETIIENGQYGGCGGTLVIRLNDFENPDYRWTWRTSENQPPNVMCFAELRTLNLQ